MRFIHLTDPHLTEPPSWRRLLGRSHFGKRFLGYASWSRNRSHRMRRAWLDEVQAEISSRKPAQILLTGDLTQIGTLEEIRSARRWLESLGTPDQVCLVPGNHDTYALDSWPNLLAEWGDYLPAEGPAGFPVVRRVGDIALFGLSSAVPTRPGSACGLLGAAQLERLSDGLNAHSGALQMLLVHHPPLPGLIQFRKRLRDAADLQQLLREAPVDVMLYGHRHRNLATERLGARLFCTAPASVARGAFRQFDIETEATGWRVRQTLIERSAPGSFRTVETTEWQVSGRD